MTPTIAEELFVIEASLRYNAPTDKVVKYLVDNIKLYSADLVMCTEAEQRGLVKALRKALPDFTIAKSGNYLWIYRKDKFTAVSNRNWTVTRVIGFPNWRQMKVGIRRLKLTKSGIVVRAMIVHGPAGIESGARFRIDKASKLAVKCAKDGWPKLGADMRSYKAHNPKHIQILVGDSNLNWRREEWRDWLGDALGGKQLWDRDYGEGTHGERCIDFMTEHGVLARWIAREVSRVKRPHIEDRNKQIDHRAVFGYLRISFPA